MAIQRLQQQYSPLSNALYCEEEQWEEKESEIYGSHHQNETNPSLFPLCFPEADSFWEEDEEFIYLVHKESQQQKKRDLQTDSSLSILRSEAVHWMLNVKSHYNFSTLTAILAIDYLDRFIYSIQFQADKPWLIQLVAVTCLSLAAKVEETQAPLLLDLQVEGTKYVFEAKTIQKMELMVLSTLQWRMNPVTPISFLNYIITRLGFQNNIYMEFLNKCESLLLSVASDSRFVRFLPSVLATASMLRVIDLIEPSNRIEYQNQLLDILKTRKEKVNECSELISELSTTGVCGLYYRNKRKYGISPGSPIGVINANFSCDSSNDSWDVGLSPSLSQEPLLKKTKVQETPLPSLSRVFVDAIGSPQ